MLGISLYIDASCEVLGKQAKVHTIIKVIGQGSKREDRITLGRRNRIDTYGWVWGGGLEQ